MSDYRKILTGPAIVLEQMLERRSKRAEEQQALLQEGGKALVSFCLNIPGDVKQFPLAKEAYLEGREALLALFPAETLLKETCCMEDTGNEGMFLLDADPVSIKRKTVELETYHPLGRLFDIDVLTPDGVILSRKDFGEAPRTCFVCGKDAKICGRSRAHSVPELQQKIAELLENYFRDLSADRIASCAARALLYEVSVTPKPGLVDRNNSGSHRDMDFYTFIDSSAALVSHFREMYCLGWREDTLPEEQFFPRLRFLGQQAEKDMFAATGGVNTHKGLIFSMGILCAALGRKHAGTRQPVPEDELFQQCAALGKEALKDFSAAETGLSPDTAGLRLYREKRIGGVREEAAEGFPAAKGTGLKNLRAGLAAGMSLNDAAAAALLSLIGALEDTNMIHRGGLPEAERCRKEARELYGTLTAENCVAELRQLDEAYIRKNLSPGGAADLLALSMLLMFLEDRAIIV